MDLDLYVLRKKIIAALEVKDGVDATVYEIIRELCNYYRWTDICGRVVITDDGKVYLSENHGLIA